MYKIIISSFDDVNNPYYAGGGAFAVREVASRLARDYEVTIISGIFPGAKNSKIDGVSYKYIGINLPFPRLGQAIYQLLLPLYCRTLNYDLWIESFTPPFSTAFLPLFTRKPVIGLVHMLSAEDMQRKYKLPFKVIENAGLKTYKRFIVMSDNEKLKILKQNKNAKVVVAGNAIAIPRINTPNKKDTILSLGRIEVNQKGLDLMINAYKKYLSKLCCKLVVAGAGAPGEESKLRDLIINSKLSDKVRMVGRVDKLQRDRLYRRTCVQLIPSRYETFSLVALEALSYGIPIVCFDIDGFNWIPNDCVIKIPAFDYDLYGKAIVRLCKDKNLSKQIGEKAKKFVSRYTWKNVYAVYRDFIAETLNENEYE